MNSYDHILFLIETKKYRFAIQELKESISLSPSDAYLFYLISFCYSKLAFYSKARFYIKKAISLEPNSILILNQYAEIEIYENKFKHGYEILDHSLSIDPNQEDAFLLKARICLLKGNIKKAVENSELALLKEPNGVLSKNIIALDLIVKGKYNDANRIISQVLSLDPLNSFSLCILGLIKFYKNQFQESREILEKTLSGDPENEWIKECLKQVIIYNNVLANLFFKLTQHTADYSRIFRLGVGIGYRLILIIGLLLYMNTGNTEFLTLIVVLMLGVYALLFIPFKAVPQILSSVLYFDPLGRYLITIKDIYTTLSTIAFFSTGILLLIFYSEWSIMGDNYMTILGLYLIFISGLPSDIVFFQDKETHWVLILFIIGCICITLIYLTIPIPIVETASIVIIAASLFIYPFIAKIMQKEFIGK
ncbi:MAG: hypothetical protein RLN81_05970 [Balneolaceae bacterium]